MRKIVLFFFCFNIVSNCGADMKYLQSTSINGGSVTNANLAFTNPIKGGSLLVAGVRIGATGRTVTVTDSNGLWTQVNSQVQTSDGHTAYIYYYPAALRERTDTVTVTISGAAATLRFAIHEYSGFGYGSVDVSSGAQQDQSTAYTTSPITVHNGETLIFGFGTNDNVGAEAITAGTEFNSRENLNCGVASVCLASEDAVIYSTGGLTRTNFTGTLLTNWTCDMGTFRSGNRRRWFK